MTCPYNYKSIKNISRGDNDLADCETGTIKACTDISVTIYERAECRGNGCGVWHDGRCCYAGVNGERQIIQ